MKSQLIFVLFCVGPSIHSFNIIDEIIYPPDVASGRIVGGKDAPDDAAPYQCSIQESKIHSCGCAIISQSWVLTASHCVFRRNATALEILVGTNDLSNGGTYYKVERYVTHEDYRRFANDIAVIRVQGKIEFNDRVQPIRVAAFNDANDGEELILTGWGDLSLGGKQPKRLQIIKLKAMSIESCGKTILRIVLHKSHLCTSSKLGEGACFGDSGGPLVKKIANKTEVVGVVNFGLPCALGIPDVYANVSYFYDWIKKHTD